jgi:hypothetical protein
VVAAWGEACTGGGAILYQMSCWLRVLLGPASKLLRCGAPGSGLRANSRPNCFFVTFYSQKHVDWCCAVFLPASRIGRWYSCVTVMCTKYRSSRNNGQHTIILNC